MKSIRSQVRVVACAAALCAAGAANATITFVTAATTQPFPTATLDTLSDLTINTLLPGLVTTRAAGPFRYTIGTTFNDAIESGLYVAPAAGTGAISTNFFSDSLVFTMLSSSVLSFGGNFFATNILGEAASGGMTLTATDTAGLSLTRTITGGALTSFAGFISDVPLRLVTVSITTPNTNIFASADNLRLTTAVPEPGTWMTLLAGLAVMTQLAAQRKKGR
jgi:hypothetical protein